MKIKFDMSWGNDVWPTEYNSIKLSNIPDKKGRYLSFFYETLGSEDRPDSAGEANISYVYYDKISVSKSATWDVDVKEINKCIIKIFTKLDEID